MVDIHAACDVELQSDAHDMYLQQVAFNDII